MRAELDKVDVAIIRALQKDARTSFSDIAKSCKVSVDTISKRFKKIKNTGVARGTTVLLNPKSFGCDCVASFGIKADFSHIDEIIGAIKKMPEIVFCNQTMGRNSIFALVIVKDVVRLNEVREIIKGNPLVKELATSIWVNDILLCPENFDLKTNCGDGTLG